MTGPQMTSHKTGFRSLYRFVRFESWERLTEADLDEGGDDKDYEGTLGHEVRPRAEKSFE